MDLKFIVLCLFFSNNLWGEKQLILSHQERIISKNSIDAFFKMWTLIGVTTFCVKRLLLTCCSGHVSSSAQGIMQFWSSNPGHPYAKHILQPFESNPWFIM